jgi:1-pyrroline-5-carboxylate dehydrogenase
MNTAKIPTPVNEPVFSYAPGSRERGELKQALKDLSGRQIEIPVVVGGKEIRTGKTVDAVMPHCHRHVLAKGSCRRLPQGRRSAGDAWRAMVNAATMLGQSKTAFQAEIDAACELIDFWRFNATTPSRICTASSRSAPGTWNQLEYRGLEGFVYAITPFNFTAIGGNLSTAPALMGNTVVWKPARPRCTRPIYLFKLLEEAGLPPGVINFVPGDRRANQRALLGDRHLAGVHFTGSTEVFRRCGRQSATNMKNYADYPRSSARPAARTSSSRTESADPRRARDRARARRLRVPGTEVLAPRAASTSRNRSGPRCASACSACSRDQAWATSGRLPQLHGRGDRQESVRQDQAVHRRRALRRSVKILSGGDCDGTRTATSCSPR